MTNEDLRSNTRHQRTIDFTITREAEGTERKDGFRTVTATLSTDEPYKRWTDGWEVLDHSKGSINTERLDDGFCILGYHDRRMPVGRLKGYEIKEHSLEVEMEIGGGSAADDIIRLLDAGVITKMSVGYEYDWDHMVSDDYGDGEFIVRLMRWVPVEGSFVTVPADNNCGVGSVREHRDHISAFGKPSDHSGHPSDDTTPDARENLSETNPTEETKQMSDNAVDTENIVKQERERSAALSKLARANGIDAATEQKWISEGTDAGAAALEVVDILNKRKADEAEKAKGEKANRPNVEFDTSNTPAIVKNETKYSLQRALSTPRSELDGIELEVHQELVKNRGRPVGETSILVDGNAFARCAYAAGRDRLSAEKRAALDPVMFAQRDVLLGSASGSNTSASGLNPDELLPSLLIPLLRNYSVLGELGVTTLGGLVGDVKLPKQTAKEVWTYAGVDETGDLAKTGTPSFSNITLSMHTAYARQGISRGALMGTTPSVFSLIMDSVAVGASETLMNTMVAGTGTGVPTGIINKSGVGEVTVAASGGGNGGATQMDYGTVEEAIGKLRDQNATRYGGNMAGKWLFLTGSQHSRLMFLPKFPSTDSQTVIMNNQIAGDEALWWNGATAQAYQCIYGNFTDTLIGIWGDSIEFRTSDHQNGGVVLSAYIDHDVQVRNAVSYVVVKP